ncbi:MAG: DUF4440 domain-containing protein [Alteromonas sp.]|nr:DUF4440 domain-containing protein [Alteromonas sp.]MAY23139.1 DUF4440 domain-containing protein [Flavobacteriaceae bacterium]|tara:strand:- start:152228 stop:152728 length:501 start_codon:yes stop_codon:yes gene_type:complete
MMKIYIYILFVLGFLTTNAQETSNSELFKILQEKDSLLFNRAFNHCESFWLEELIAKDFEFYHDQGGINDSKEAFLKTMKEGICHPNNPIKSRRQLLKNTLKVYPLYDNGKLYGALQKGEHEFFQASANEVERKTSKALFSHLWILENNEWKLKRVFSYNHTSPSP